MKLMHLGDLHLGRSLAGFDLAGDQKYILDRILELTGEREVDAVLVAGDIYDKTVPSEAATGLLDYFLRSLSEKKVNTFLISGNHDSDDRLDYGSSLFKNSHIYISAKFNGKLEKNVLKGEDGNVNIWSLPFVKASVVRHFFPDEKIETYEDAVRVIIEKADIDESECNILIAHQFVTGRGEDPSPGGSESRAALCVGLVEKIGSDVFDKFDYVALGHIHSPQRVGRDEVRYAGSPLKYSLSEVNNEKSVPLITVKGKKEIDTELIPLRPLRDLRHIRGELKELVKNGDISSAEDLIYVTLTDEETEDNAIGILRQTYPNIVKLDYDNSHTREIETVDISRIAENRSFSGLISDFYRMIYGAEISDEEMDVMRMAAKEAGIIDEAG